MTTTRSRRRSAGSRGAAPGSAVQALDRRIRKMLTAPQRTAMQQAIRSLDRLFVEEKCQVLIDTALEIQRLGSLKRSALLQRNLWGSMDALAQHFDAKGFTQPFCKAAANVLGQLKFTDSDVGEAEYRIVSSGLGRRAKGGKAFSRPQFDSIMKLAERYRTGKKGVKNIARKSFTFASAARSACHRPLDVLAVHRVGKLAVVKVPIAFIMGAVNVITLFLAFWPVTFVTIGVLLIIWAAGC